MKGSHFLVFGSFRIADPRSALQVCPPSTRNLIDLINVLLVASPEVQLQIKRDSPLGDVLCRSFQIPGALNLDIDVTSRSFLVTFAEMIFRCVSRYLVHRNPNINVILESFSVTCSFCANMTTKFVHQRPGLYDGW